MHETEVGGDTKAQTLKNELIQISVELDIKEQILQTIYNRVEDYAFFTMDLSGNITSWALGCELLFHYSKKEAIHSPFSFIYPDYAINRKEPDEHLLIAFKNGKFRGEGYRIKKDGSLFMGDILITPMFDKDEVIGYFSTISNISEKNVYIQERELDRSRIRELQNENTLRDKFIYLLAHDLRNPLTAAKICSQIILRKSCNNYTHHELAQKTLQHISKVDKMITDLLDVSRLREGETLPVTKSEVNLTELLQDTLESMATTYGDRFILKLQKNIIAFLDPDAFVRVVENLITNAVKYGDPTANITIGLEKINERFIVKVHNFGHPMNEQEKDSLFGIFRRGEGTEKKLRGWGLGLALVSGITEAHEGVVKVTSLPLEGTTFILDWPINRKIFKKSDI